MRTTAVLVLLGLLTGCFPAYAVRAPISPCTAACAPLDTDRHALAVCYERCAGSTRSYHDCSTADRSVLVCSNDSRSLGISEATGTLVALLGFAALIVYGVQKDE